MPKCDTILKLDLSINYYTTVYVDVVVCSYNKYKLVKECLGREWCGCDFNKYLCKINEMFNQIIDDCILH